MLIAGDIFNPGSLDNVTRVRELHDQLVALDLGGTWPRGFRGYPHALASL